eukprot:TRINITY_DN93000_c0_g1_i1.p2 TRINITY_DN93000_c0_g1~~TRINITY_DN93000_c0_g1_i1.p2  ORF type:complete len:148 (-),score=12.75 TRINITY_DN93000_c0_g1_i1:175-591(-)
MSSSPASVQLILGLSNPLMPMKSDKAVGRVWRFPTYYEGGYDKNCLVQCAIVECFRDIKPPRMVPRDEVVAGGGVRDVSKLRQREKAKAARRHSTVPPGRSAEQSPTAALGLQVAPPPGPKPTSMRPRPGSTSRVSRQ